MSLGRNAARPDWPACAVIVPHPVDRLITKRADTACSHLQGAFGSHRQKSLALVSGL